MQLIFKSGKVSRHRAEFRMEAAEKNACQGHGKHLVWKKRRK
jgi:hypothetical protein